MAIRGPRLEFAVGAFLLLALASLLVLALASTNRQFGFGGDTYPLVAKFTQLGQLRANAPVKIGGVVVGQVSKIDLDPKTFQSPCRSTAVTRSCPRTRRQASSPAACSAKATSACRRAAIRNR